MWERAKRGPARKCILHRPQKELLEVMLVSKAWMESVIQSWSTVEVFRERDLGAVVAGVEDTERVEEGKVPDILCQVLRVAENVRFPRTWDRIRKLSVSSRYHMISPMLLGHRLRCLDLPGTAVTPSLLTALSSSCPNLTTFVFNGNVREEGGEGERTAHICHPRLETLRFLECLDPFILSVDCPALLDLYVGEENHEWVDYEWCLSHFRAHALFDCPQLSRLFFPNCYSEEGVLEAIAAHAPGIKELKLCVRNSLESLTYFKALQDLKLLNLNEHLPGKAFVGMPNLERLELKGDGVSRNIKFVLPGLRSLTLNGSDECVALDLDCPSLEYLLINNIKFSGKWYERFACPLLKKVHLSYDFNEVENDGGYESVELKYHCDTVQDLVLQSLEHENIVVSCKKLERLAISWYPLAVAVGQLFTEPPMRLPTVNCPNLKSIELDGYPFIFFIISSLLAHAGIGSYEDILLSREYERSGARTRKTL